MAATDRNPKAQGYMDKMDGTLQEAQASTSWFEDPVCAEDVVNAYRLVLGREPENDDVVQQQVGFTRRRMIVAFATSEEFLEKIGPIKHDLLGRVQGDVLVEIDAALLNWGWRLLDRTPMPGVSRLPFFAALFGTDVLASDLAANLPPHHPGPQALSHAVERTIEAAGVIRASPLFEANHYTAQLAGRKPADLAEHYLLAGEHLNLRPSPGFDPLHYQLDTIDLHSGDGSALLHYETVGRAQGRPLPDEASSVVRQHADAIRASEFFDEVFYRSQLGDDGQRVKDAALHYLVEGEARGYSPSASFDPIIYAEIHPDIHASDVNRLLHYQLNGRDEGRAYRSFAGDLGMPVADLDPDKPTVILLLHQATHTGAPILGWNMIPHLSRFANVVTIMRDGGSLEPALAAASTVCLGPLPTTVAVDPNQLGQLARRLARCYRPAYVIANSFEARLLALALREQDVPIVALIHEFTIGQRSGVRSPYYSQCSAIVFPAELVRASALRAFRETALQNTYIIPQGQSRVPPLAQRAGAAIGSGLPGLVQEEDDRIPATLPALLGDGSRGDGPFTVIGLGTAELRKGIDLFIATAVALKARHPELPFRFIWIGDWQYVVGTNYGDLLGEQANRSGLGDQLHFFGATDDLDSVYHRADALFLCSRLDPLPNVGIDAAVCGIPIVCFRDASGIAELLGTRAATADLVVPHLDTGAAADRLAMLAADREAYRTSSEAVRMLAEETFDMAAYVGRVHEIGLAAVAKFEALESEAALIARSGLLGDPAQAAPAGAVTIAERYLESTRQINFAAPPVWGVGFSRTVPGFQPFIYGDEAPGFPKDGSRDPLAHYLESGKPAGRWVHPVIRIEDEASRLGKPGRLKTLSRLLRIDRRPPAIRKLRVAMHGHFHYTDNFEEFLQAIDKNQLSMDLFLTTTSSEAAAFLVKRARSYNRGKVLVLTDANIGRDILPFINVLRDYLLGSYDWVGHLHGKRSVHTLSFDSDLGNRWRTFLWEHMLGPKFSTADVILSHVAEDPHLGLVFPENDFTISWEKNLAFARVLATKIGIRRPLPANIEFPVGTMFWARPEALAKLVTRDIALSDYPPEPLPIDGTMLHAIERLLPLICEDAGYHYATTYISDVRR